MANNTEKKLHLQSRQSNNMQNKSKDRIKLHQLHYALSFDFTTYFVCAIFLTSFLFVVVFTIDLFVHVCPFSDYDEVLFARVHNFPLFMVCLY